MSTSSKRTQFASAPGAGVSFSHSADIGGISRVNSRQSLQSHQSEASTSGAPVAVLPEDLELNRRAELELNRLSLFVGTAHGRYGIAVAGVVMTKSKAAVMATSAVTAIATLARIYTE